MRTILINILIKVETKGLLQLEFENILVSNENEEFSIEFNFIAKAGVIYDKKFKIKKNLYEAIILLKNELARKNESQLFERK